MDKTANYYKIKVEDHNKLLNQAIHKDYMKAQDGTEGKIRSEHKELAQQLDIEDRLEISSKAEAFITLKDHKQDFYAKPSTILINPNKQEIGVISKKILADVVVKVRKESKVNQWTSMEGVIKWFLGIKNKQKLKFIKWDIEAFYPSISQKLLLDAINHARKYVHISDLDVNIIMKAKSSLLYSKGQAWTKKQGLFDITMGSMDGAESCEVCGLYILSKLQHLEVDMGLYRDDGIVVTR